MKIDNLKSRISRMYFDKREFKDENGKTVEYERLVLEVLIKGEIFNLEFKLDRKERAILMLSDDLSQGMTLN